MPRYPTRPHRGRGAYSPESGGVYHRSRCERPVGACLAAPAGAIHLTGGEASDSKQFEILLDIGPDITPTLAAIGAQLEAMRQRTPHRGWRWAPSSVANLLERARAAGLLGEGGETEQVTR